MLLWSLLSPDLDSSIPRFLTIATQSDPGPERTVRKLDPAWMRETFELNLFGHVQMTSELFNSGSVILLRNPTPCFVLRPATTVVFAGNVRPTLVAVRTPARHRHLCHSCAHRAGRQH